MKGLESPKGIPLPGSAMSNDWSVLMYKRLAFIWDHSEELSVRSVDTAVTDSLPTLILLLIRRCGSQKFPLSHPHLRVCFIGNPIKIPLSSLVLSSDFHILGILRHFSFAIVSSFLFISIFLSSALILVIFLQGIWGEHVYSIYHV